MPNIHECLVLLEHGRGTSQSYVHSVHVGDVVAVFLEEPDHWEFCGEEEVLPVRGVVASRERAVVADLDSAARVQCAAAPRAASRLPRIEAVTSPVVVSLPGFVG